MTATAGLFIVWLLTVAGPWLMFALPAALVCAFLWTER